MFTMSQLENIQLAQKSLEDCFAKRMADLESQIQSVGPAKETVAKVAEEFRAFRELVFNMLGLLRKQIEECSNMVDAMETRHRRKNLIFLGVAEVEKEDCAATVLDILRTKMTLKDVSMDSITVCHRLGAPNKEHHRPILVRFAQANHKASVWKAKTGLKGSKISVKEFLTRPRQSLFIKARQHFGMRSCWTQDGVIIVKIPNGTRAKVTCAQDLTQLLAKHPCVVDKASSAARNDTGTSKSTTRKNQC